MYRYSYEFYVNVIFPLANINFRQVPKYHVHISIIVYILWGFPGGSLVKNPPTNARDIEDMGLIPGSERSPDLRRKRKPTPVFLPRKSHEQGSPAGYSPWGHRARQDWAHTHAHSYFVIFKIKTRIWGIKTAIIIQTTAHIKMHY